MMIKLGPTKESSKPTNMVGMMLTMKQVLNMDEGDDGE
jgi:UPF0288 family protein (methanogenesis marker protein 3)